MKYQEVLGLIKRAADNFNIPSLKVRSLERYPAQPLDEELLKKQIPRKWNFPKNFAVEHTSPSNRNFTPTELLNYGINASKWLTNPIGAIGAGASALTRNGIPYKYIYNMIRPINYAAPAGLTAQAIHGNEAANRKLVQGMNNWQEQQIKAQQNKYK